MMEEDEERADVNISYLTVIMIMVLMNFMMMRCCKHS